MGARVVRARARGADDVDGRLTGDAQPGGSRLRLVHDVDLNDVAESLLLERWLERDLPHIRVENWSTSGRELPNLGEPILSIAQPYGETRLADFAGALVLSSLTAGHAHATVAASSADAAAALLARLHELLPAPDPSSVHEVPVVFWTYGPRGAAQSWRSIVVPAWEEIEENYSAPLRAKLERLMRDFRPAHGGQLVLWHGIAGTGKTFGLRALAWEWREWCDFHYIVDPDAFFGEHADYLMGVLLQPEYLDEGGGIITVTSATSHYYSSFRRHGDLGEEDDDEEPRGAKWRVLLLEDTGELLAADARVRVGQGLSRFLNVVDGLIGQGLKVLVLVTTNEEVRKLHPAVARPGRSAANVEFVPLTVDEANAWLERHGVAERVQGSTTLASLYARKEGLDPGSAATSPGFGG